MNLLSGTSELKLDRQQEKAIYELTLKKQRSKKSTISQKQAAAMQQLANELVTQRKDFSELLDYSEKKRHDLDHHREHHNQHQLCRCTESTLALAAMAAAAVTGTPGHLREMSPGSASGRERPQAGDELCNMELASESSTTATLVLVNGANRRTKRSGSKEEGVSPPTVGAELLQRQSSTSTIATTSTSTSSTCSSSNSSSEASSSSSAPSSSAASVTSSNSSASDCGRRQQILQISDQRQQQRQQQQQDNINSHRGRLNHHTSSSSSSASSSSVSAGKRPLSPAAEAALIARHKNHPISGSSFISTTSTNLTSYSTASSSSLMSDETNIKLSQLRLDQLNNELERRLHQYEYLVAQEKAILGAYKMNLFTSEGVNNFHLFSLDQRSQYYK